MPRTEGISSSDIRSKYRSINLGLVGNGNILKKFFDESKLDDYNTEPFNTHVFRFIPDNYPYHATGGQVTRVELYPNKDIYEMRISDNFKSEDAIKDVITMKANNINAIRTSHYPDDSILYELCDIYGLYMIAENNLEGNLSKKIKELREELVELMAQIEVSVDYPEYDYDEVEPTSITSLLDRKIAEIQHIIDTYEHGKYIKNGVKEIKVEDLKHTDIVILPSHIQSEIIKKGIPIMPQIFKRSTDGIYTPLKAMKITDKK